jgi:NAD(P)-dependent dehydrogenase (short-subunit alcohol dehydrogenase family)
VKFRHACLGIAVIMPTIHVRKLMCDYTGEEYDWVANLNLRGTFFFLSEFGALRTRKAVAASFASSPVRATTLEPGPAI